MTTRRKTAQQMFPCSQKDFLNLQKAFFPPLTVSSNKPTPDYSLDLLIKGTYFLALSSDIFRQCLLENAVAPEQRTYLFSHVYG